MGMKALEQITASANEEPLPVKSFSNMEGSRLGSSATTASRQCGGINGSVAQCPALRGMQKGAHRQAGRRRKSTNIPRPLKPARESPVTVAHAGIASCAQLAEAGTRFKRRSHNQACAAIHIIYFRVQYCRRPALPGDETGARRTFDAQNLLHVNVALDGDVAACRAHSIQQLSANT